MDGEEAKALKDERAAEIGRRIKAARKALYPTQAQAAARFGVHPHTYHLYETGARVRSWTRVIDLCEAFDVSPNELFGYDPADKLDTMVKDALDPQLLGSALEAIAELAIARATEEHPSGGDAEFWEALGGAFAEVIAMTIRGTNAELASGFLTGVSYLLRR